MFLKICKNIILERVGAARPDVASPHAFLRGTRIFRVKVRHELIWSAVKREEYHEEGKISKTKGVARRVIFSRSSRASAGFFRKISSMMLNPPAPIFSFDFTLALNISRPVPRSGRYFF